MGYQTKHDITLSAPLPEPWSPDDGGESGTTIEPGELHGHMTGKWYERRTDMAALSSRYPDVLFTIKGQGEDTGDLWVEYWRDGKVQCEVPTFAPFDPSKLRSPDD